MAKWDQTLNNINLIMSATEHYVATSQLQASVGMHVIVWDTPLSKLTSKRTNASTSSASFTTREKSQSQDWEVSAVSWI